MHELKQLSLTHILTAIVPWYKGYYTIFILWVNLFTNGLSEWINDLAKQVTTTRAWTESYIGPISLNNDHNIICFLLSFYLVFTFFIVCLYIN